MPTCILIVSLALGISGKFSGEAALPIHEIDIPDIENESNRNSSTFGIYILRHKVNKKKHSKRKQRNFWKTKLKT